MMDRISARDSRMAFLDMLRKKRPEIYARLMQQSRVRGLSGLGADVSTAPAPAEEKSWVDTAIESLQTLAPAYAQYQLSRDLYDLNMERARQGLPPIDAASLSPQMQVGLTEETRLMILGLGAVALISVLALARKK